MRLLFLILAVGMIEATFAWGDVVQKERFLGSQIVEVTECKTWMMEGGWNEKWGYSFSVWEKITKQLWLEEDGKTVRESFREVANLTQRATSKSCSKCNRPRALEECEALRDPFTKIAEKGE